MPKCPHNRRKSICKECKGSSICEHNRIKYMCKECGYIPKLCPHNRIKAECHKCGGSAICRHLKIRSKCKECLADKDNTIPEIEEYTKEEYEIISFLAKK